jgi:hypothetical protein
MLFLRWARERLSAIPGQQPPAEKLARLRARKEWENEVLHTAATPKRSMLPEHIFALAQVICRPIICYGPTQFAMMGLGLIEYPPEMLHNGIYLPLLRKPEECSRDPLVIVYTAGHFSSAVPMEHDSAEAAAQQQAEIQMVALPFAVEAAIASSRLWRPPAAVVPDAPPLPPPLPHLSACKPSVDTPTATAIDTTTDTAAAIITADISTAKDSSICVAALSVPLDMATATTTEAVAAEPAPKDLEALSAEIGANPTPTVAVATNSGAEQTVIPYAPNSPVPGTSPTEEEDAELAQAIALSMMPATPVGAAHPPMIGPQLPGAGPALALPQTDESDEAHARWLDACMGAATGDVEKVVAYLEGPPKRLKGSIVACADDSDTLKPADPEPYGDVYTRRTRMLTAIDMNLLDYRVQVADASTKAVTATALAADDSITTHRDGSSNSETQEAVPTGGENTVEGGQNGSGSSVEGEDKGDSVSEDAASPVNENMQHGAVDGRGDRLGESIPIASEPDTDAENIGPPAPHSAASNSNNSNSGTATLTTEGQSSAEPVCASPSEEQVVDGATPPDVSTAESDSHSGSSTGSEAKASTTEAAAPPPYHRPAYLVALGAAQVNCEICFCEHPATEVESLGCQHFYCRDCWGGHIRTKCENGQTVIGCPGEKCLMVLTDALVEQVLNTADIETYKNAKSSPVKFASASTGSALDFRVYDTLAEIATRHEQWAVIEKVSGAVSATSTVMKRSLSQLCLELVPLAEDVRTATRAMLKIPEISGQIDYKVIVAGNQTQDSVGWHSGWLKITPALDVIIAKPGGMGAMLQAGGPSAALWSMSLREIIVKPPRNIKAWSTGEVGTISRVDNVNMLCAELGKHPPAVEIRLRAKEPNSTTEAERWRWAFFERSQLAAMPGHPPTEVVSNVQNTGGAANATSTGGCGGAVGEDQSEQIANLMSMGFNDVVKIRELLAKHKNDVSKVATELSTGVATSSSTAPTTASTAPIVPDNGGAQANNSQAVPASRVVLDEELAQLSNMGFLDVVENRRLLSVSKDVNEAVQYLLRQKTPPLPPRLPMGANSTHSPPSYDDATGSSSGGGGGVWPGGGVRPAGLQSVSTEAMLTQLASMGFNDTNHNLALLTKHSMNIETVTNALLSGETSTPHISDSCPTVSPLPVAAPPTKGGDNLSSATPPAVAVETVTDSAGGPGEGADDEANDDAPEGGSVSFVSLVDKKGDLLKIRFLSASEDEGYKASGKDATNAKLLATYLDLGVTTSGLLVARQRANLDPTTEAMVASYLMVMRTRQDRGRLNMDPSNSEVL